MSYYYEETCPECGLVTWAPINAGSPLYTMPAYRVAGVHHAWHCSRCGKRVMNFPGSIMSLEEIKEKLKK